MTCLENLEQLWHLVFIARPQYTTFRSAALSKKYDQITTPDILKFHSRNVMIMFMQENVVVDVSSSDMCRIYRNLLGTIHTNCFVLIYKKYNFATIFVSYSSEICI